MKYFFKSLTSTNVAMSALLSGEFDAAHHVAGFDLYIGGGALGARFACFAAAFRKGTACRQLCGVRHKARNGREPVHRFVQVRNGAEQADGVRMGRMLINVFERTVFHDFASIDDRDLAAYFRNDAEVVRDQEQGSVELLFKLFDELKHLRLNGYVKCRCGFICNQKRRVAGKRDCDHNTLLHAAGECSCAIK